MARSAPEMRVSSKCSASLQDHCSVSGRSYRDRGRPLPTQHAVQFKRVASPLFIRVLSPHFTGTSTYIMKLPIAGVRRPGTGGGCCLGCEWCEPEERQRSATTGGPLHRRVPRSARRAALPARARGGGRAARSARLRGHRRHHPAARQLHDRHLRVQPFLAEYALT